MRKELMAVGTVRNDEAGYALIAALMALVLVTVIGLSAMDTAITEKDMSTGTKRYRQELKEAETAAFEGAHRIENDPNPDVNLKVDQMPKAYSWLHGTDIKVNNGQDGQTAFNQYVCDYVTDPANPLSIDEYMMVPTNWNNDTASASINCTDSIQDPVNSQFFVVNRGPAAKEDRGLSSRKMMYCFEIFGRYFQQGVGWRVVKLGYNMGLNN